MIIFRQIAETYKLAFLYFLLALPLALIPVFAEGLQHLAEYKLGMFSMAEGEKFGDKRQSIRMVFGVIKVSSIILTVILLSRFFLKGRSVGAALKFEPHVTRALVKGFLFTAFVVIWMVLIGPKVLLNLMPSLGENKAMILSMLIPMALMTPFQFRINQWVATVFGMPPIDKAESKMMDKTLLTTGLIVLITAIIPAMVFHYWLGYGAMGQSGFSLLGLLTLDSIIVGVLAALGGAAHLVIIRDARKSY